MADALPIDDSTADRLRPVLKLEKFFPQSLTAKVMRLLFPHSGLFRYAPEEFILCQGDESKDLYVVYSGAVLITKTLGTAGVVLATLGPGDIFGEIALVRDGVRVANAVTSQESLIFRLAYIDVHGLVTRNPDLAAHLSELARRRSGG